MRIGTICTRSYLAHARTLGFSLAEQEPDLRLLAVAIGDVELADTEPFDILRPEELPLPSRVLESMRRRYPEASLARALKPWVLRHLLDAGADAAVWLDADIAVYAPLEGLEALAARSGIVLTPHSIVPVARPFRGGPFNSGFLAVGQAARPFLKWWAERLLTDCVVDYSRGLCEDQGWLKLVPCYFEHHVLRDPGWNVAYWNLPERPLAWAGGRYEVDSRPLRFFHFSGFDPHDPESPSRFALGELAAGRTPIVAQLCRAYAAQLFEQGYEAPPGGVRVMGVRPPERRRVLEAVARRPRAALWRRRLSSS